ncbi:hypothetical protein HK096_007066, partial [Nowakowskiella sp. JEL0078]
RVCDLCEETSGGGLYDQLESEGASLYVYETVMNLYFDNSVFNAIGGVDSSFAQSMANQIQLGDRDNREQATEDELDDTGKECGVDVILEIATESSSDFEELLESK